MKPLSQAAVRGLMIAAQGLLPNTKSAIKDDLVAAIRQMHMLQIDSISVIARSHQLVLWSRLGHYDPNWLDELLAEGALIEYWAHAACILPSEDYLIFKHQHNTWIYGRADKWLKENAAVVEAVLTHIRTHGETRASDFERTDGQKTGWFNWKDEKIALEYLFFAGQLMVRKRHNFQRVYDFPERVQPQLHQLPPVPMPEAHDQYVLNTVQALGVTKPEWISDYYRLKKADTNAALKRLLKQGRLHTVTVEGWDKPGYYHPDHHARLEAAAAGQIPQSKTTFLSPFDPLVWDRARASDLFGFDYKIEIYTPEPKRKYGYFTLPILYNNALIGRLDPKAHRKTGIFEVKALHLEPGIIVDDALISELKTTLQACAAWHQTPQVIVRQASVPGLAEQLTD